LSRKNKEKRENEFSDFPVTARTTLFSPGKIKEKRKMSSTTSQRSRAIFSEKKSHKRGLLGPFEVEMWGMGYDHGEKTKKSPARASRAF
jgi:hypothetical protein